MKFLIFSPYYPPHTGGLESHSAEFNREITTLGHSVIVFTPRLPNNAPEKEVFTDGTVLRFPAFEIISNYPLPKFWKKKFWNLLKEALAQRPDIIITRTRFFFTSFFGLMVAKINQIKLVHIEHGSDFVKLSNPLSSALAYLYDQTFGRAVLRYSTLTIAISTAVQRFVKKFDKRFSPVIYRGLDFSQLDAAPLFTPSTLEPYAGKIIVTTAARLYKWKGIEDTLKTLRVLPAELLSRLIFVVVGDGEDKKRLEELSKDLPIIFLGRLSREETIGFLKRADIYIHSSHPGGGLSTSLLEAMYCQCAVIATPHEGADEIINHRENGLLVENKNFKEALVTLLNQPKNGRALATQAHIAVREKFSWSESIHQYLTYFKAL